MVKKLSKYGNSLAIIIDKPILELLDISENTKLKIKTDGKNIIIEPVKTKLKKSKISNDKKLQKDYEDLVDKYSPALKKLAK